jgi:hypothetical protein
MNLMIWFTFTLPRDEDLFQKQEDIIHKLRGLFYLFTDGDHKGTMLLYGLPLDSRFVQYYFTSNNKLIERNFSEMTSAKPCSPPEFNRNKYISVLKFLEGDKDLFNEIQRSISKF